MLLAVIFDMDGVIIDSHPAHRKAWKTFLQTLGKAVSDRDLDFVLDGRKRGEILRHFLGELTEDEVREYGTRKDEFFRKASLEIRPIPGVIHLLERLRRGGIKAAIATSGSESRIRHSLERLNLLDRFSVIVTGNDVIQGKPDPSIYRLACEQLNVAPVDAVAFEDAVSGVRSATGAGLTCIGVAGHQSRDQLQAAGAAHVVRNFVGLSLPQLERILLRQSHRRVPSFALLNAQ